MKRLRDLREAKDEQITLRDAKDATSVEAARLFAEAQPYAASPARKARVRAALSDSARQSVLVRRAVFRRALQPAIIALVVVGLIAGAGAAIRHVIAERASGSSIGVSTQSPANPIRRKATPDPIAPVEKSAVPSPKPAADSSPARPPVDSQPPPDSLTHSGSAPRPQSRVPPPKPAPSQADPAVVAQSRAESLESSVVLDAIRALRRDHDAARASMLLDYYLRRQPNGLLAEEALALNIEALAAQNDPRAGVLAVGYLKGHPLGRYRVTAERAVGRFTDIPPPP